MVLECAVSRKQNLQQKWQLLRPFLYPIHTDYLIFMSRSAIQNGSSKTNSLVATAPISMRPNISSRSSITSASLIYLRFHSVTYSIPKHWVAPPRLGPIFLYCGNEGDIEGFAANTGFVWENAPRFGALVIFPEHESMSFCFNTIKES